jgi:hypothetical protein
MPTRIRSSYEPGVANHGLRHPPEPEYAGRTKGGWSMILAGLETASSEAGL